MRTCARGGSRPRSRDCCVRGRPRPGAAARRAGRWCRRMPRALAVDVDLFSRGGLAILDRIEAQGFDVLIAPAGAGQAREGRAPAAGRCWRRPGRRGGTTAAPAPGGSRAPDGRRRSRGELRLLRRPLAARGEELLLGFLLLPGRPPPVDVGPLRLHAAHRRPRRRAGRPRGEGRRRSTPGGVDLDAALGGRPDAWPGLPALADTVRPHGIPARYLHEVIDGVEMDLEPRASRRSTSCTTTATASPRPSGSAACTSGAIRSEGGRAEALAEACGLALQLTNILRDVGEDARNGRVYLPQDDLARFGVAPDDLTRRAAGERASGLCSPSQATRAYEYYEKAAPLVALVDAVGRPVLRAIVGDLPGPARRDRPPRLRRPDRPGLGSRLAEGGDRAAGAAEPVRGPRRLAAAEAAPPMSRPSSRSPPPPHVVIVGGGLAGLAAAVGAGRARLDVTLLESRPRLGGRASSFPDPATRRAGRQLPARQHGLLHEPRRLLPPGRHGRPVPPRAGVVFLSPEGRHLDAQGAARCRPRSISSGSFLRANYLTLVGEAPRRPTAWPGSRSTRPTGPASRSTTGSAGTARPTGRSSGTGPRCSSRP